MLYIKRGQENRLVVTVSQHKELSSNYFLFSFEHILSKEKVRFYPQNVSTYTNRFDEFLFVESEDENLSLTPPYVTFPFEGDYYYSVYQMSSSASTNPAFAYAKLEEGRAYVSGDTTSPFYSQFLSDNEDNENYIFLSDNEERPISLNYCNSFILSTSVPGGYAGDYDLAYTGNTPLIGYTSGASSPFVFVCGTAPDGKNYTIFTGGTSGNTMVYNADSLNYQVLRISGFSGCNLTHTYPTRISYANDLTFEYNDLYFPYGSYLSSTITYYDCPLFATPTPTVTATITPTPTYTPTQTYTPSVTPTLTPSDTPNPVCPQQLEISNTSQPSFIPNGTYNELRFTTGGTIYEHAYFSSNQIYLGTAPDGNNYKTFGFVSGITYYQYVWNIGGSNWGVARSNYAYLNSGGTYTGAAFLGANSSIVYGGSYLPATGNKGASTTTYYLAYPELCPTPTPTSTPSCPLTTQYLKVELQENTKFKLSLWNDSGFSTPADALCDYTVSGTATGDMGTVYTGTEQILEGQHQKQFDLAGVLQPGEVIIDFSVYSVNTSTCTCPVTVNFSPYFPTPTPTASVTPTPSVTPSVTPTQSVTPSVTPTYTPTATPSGTALPTPTPTYTPSVTPSPTASSFSPSDLSGLTYWNIYSDASYLTLDTDTYDSVESITDANTSTTIFSNYTKSEQSKYNTNGYSTGVGAIYGNTSSTTLGGLTGTTTLSSEYTIFVSFKPTSSHTENTTALDSSDNGMGYGGGGFTFRHHQLKTIQDGGINYLVALLFNTSGTPAFSYPGISANPLQLTNGVWYNIAMRVRNTGGNVELTMYNGNNSAYDTSTISGTGASGTQKVVLNWNAFEDELITEQFMYNRALSTTEIDDVMTYLNGKY